MAAYDGPQVVGMDLHRRRSVLVRMTPEGEKLATVRIANSPERLSAEIAKAGPAPEVVLEATYGWYWAADTLAQAGATVHLAHPLGVKMFTYRRVKNDERDAGDLADLLRMGRLPESWIAPPEIRGLRELVRYRHKLVGIRTSCKDQIHAVLAKCGVFVPMADVFGAAGVAMLDRLRLPAPYAARINSLRRVIDGVSFEITLLADGVAAHLARDRGYQAIQALSGIGPVLAAIFVVEIGDITRFRTPAQLCSWAGLTPRHDESDTKSRNGRITKQGSRLLRWAAVEAIQRAPAGSPMRHQMDAIIARRGNAARNIAKVAAAHTLLTLVFYGLRDGEIRCLAGKDAA
jgi:transposase